MEPKRLKEVQDLLSALACEFDPNLQSQLDVKIVSRVPELLTYIFTLETENIELRKDRERLNWLEAHRVWMDDEGVKMFKRREKRKIALREAIDTAMPSEEKREINHTEWHDRNR